MNSENGFIFGDFYGNSPVFTPLCLHKVSNPWFLFEVEVKSVSHRFSRQKAILSAFYLSQNFSRRVFEIPRMCTGIEKYRSPGFKVLETQCSIQVKSSFESTL